MTDFLKITLNGHEFDADAVTALMDDDLREELASRDWSSVPAGEAAQAFVDAYCVAHAAKFGEEFVVN